MRGGRPLPERSAAGDFVTAEAVAERAGVSRSAVSRTFTPGASVSPAMRQRVLEAAETLGYRVNRVARSLVSAQSSMVGLVGTNLGTPFHAAQVAQLSEALLRRGMECMLLNAAHPAGIAPLLERLLEFRARAVVILSGSPPASIVEECLRSGLRVILISRPAPGMGAEAILADDADGARLALEHLLRAGCRRLALVGSGSGTPSIMRRMRAFRAGAAREGLTVAEWGTGPTGYDTGLQAAQTLLPGDDIDGAFCVTDLLALGFMDGARAILGLRVPRELSVIGFDDIPQAAWQAYRLTTIRQSVPRLTEAVMAALEREGRSRRTTLTLPVELVERDSVRAVNHAIPTA